MQNDLLKTRRYDILLELAVVAAAGAVVAFAANRISAHGLEVTRNYFPTGTNNLLRSALVDVPPNSQIDGISAKLYFEKQLAMQLRDEGLQLIGNSRALKLFHDSRRDKSIIFVDARDRLNYLRGHIPGAYELDPYHPQEDLPVVLPICRTARQVVLYCNGGECDDSHSAALLLKQMGIEESKLLVYGGGITEWTADHLPVQINQPATAISGVVKQ